MLVKDMKPNTAYATISGKLVVTMDTVERGWNLIDKTEFPSGGGRIETREVVKRGGNTPARLTSENDPWATGQPKQTRARESSFQTKSLIRDGIRVRRPGVLPTGAPAPIVEKTPTTVIAPKDIGGLWTEFVRLHPEQVLTVNLQAAAASDRKALSAQLSDVMEALKIKCIEPDSPKAWKIDVLEPVVKVGCETVTYQLDGTRPGWSHGVVADFATVPQITFIGMESVNKLLKMLGQPLLTTEGITGNTRAKRVEEIRVRFDKLVGEHEYLSSLKND